MRTNFGENVARQRGGGRCITGIAAEARLTNLLDLGDHGPCDLHRVQGGNMWQRTGSEHDELIQWIQARLLSYVCS